MIINGRRACARGIVLTLCVRVCLEFAAFNSRLYIKYDIPFYFSPIFLGFKFCRFRQEAFVVEKERFSQLFCSLQLLNGSVYYTCSSAFYVVRTSVLSRQ